MSQSLAGTPELLAIRFSSLGDIVLALPALALLRERSPAARIVLATKESYAPLAATCRAIDEVVTLGVEESGWRGTLELARRLRARRFAAVYDLHGSLRSRFIAAFAGAGEIRRVRGRGIARRRLVVAATARRLFHRSRGPAAATGEPLAALAAARVIEPGIRPEDLLSPTLELPIAAIESATDLLAGMPRPCIVLCPGARHATKRWPGFASLASELEKRGMGVLAVLGPHDAWNGPPRCRIVRRPLVELAAVLAGADAAIGNDSGLTHVAAAVGTPTVVIFGATVSAFGFRPIGPHRAIERLDLGCRPCSVHGGPSCPRHDLACLNGVSTSEVLAAVEDLIGASRRELVHAR